MIENKISKAIIGCAIEVHRKLGPGLSLCPSVQQKKLK